MKSITAHFFDQSGSDESSRELMESTRSVTRVDKSSSWEELTLTQKSWRQHVPIIVEAPRDVQGNDDEDVPTYC